ncbi:MAG: sulfite exporter TauE/SafE family protein [Desulfovibrionaceae bacterium]
MSPYLANAPIFFIAGLMQGATGFGSVLVALPLVTLLLDVKQAVPLTTLNAFVITVALGYSLRRVFDRDKVLPLVVGCLPGSLLGVYLLKSVDSKAILFGLGVLLLCFAVWGLFFRQAPRGLSTRWGYLSGFLTGAIGAAASAGGPPTLIYMALTGWSKDTVRATLSWFFLFTGTVTVLAHALSGVTTSHVLGLFAASAPCSFVGVLAGMRLARRLTEHGYRTAMFVLIACLGSMLLARVM